MRLWFKKRAEEPEVALPIGYGGWCMCFAGAVKRGRTSISRKQLAADPDPTIISQLIETGRAEVDHGG